MDGPFTKELRQYCSTKCQEVDMDWMPREKEAMKAGMTAFGEYMESLERPKLLEAFTHISAAEFVAAFECYTHTYHEFLANKKVLHDAIPY